MRVAWLLVLSFLTASMAWASPQDIVVSLSDANPAARDAGSTQAVSASEVRTLARRVEQSLRDVVLRGALDPGIRGRTAAPVQLFALEVGTDGTTVGKAKLSWRLDDYNSSVDVILKGPINQSSGTPLTDRGLADGASATLGYSLTLWGSSVSAQAGASAVTRTVAPTGLRLSPLEALVATGVAVREDGRARRRLGVAARQPSDTMTDPLLRTLNENRVAAAFESDDPRRIGFELRKSRMATLERTVSLSGSYGVGSHTFRLAELADPLVETIETKQDTSFAVNVAYLQILRDGDDEAPLMLVSGGYTNQDAHLPRRARQICTPLGVGAAQECRSLIIGKPTPVATESVEFDVRSWSYAQKLGVNPHFSYDLEAKQWTSEVGLSYLVLQEGRPANSLPLLNANALTVGVRVGTRPKEAGGPYASVFFATVLGVK